MTETASSAPAPVDEAGDKLESVELYNGGTLFHADAAATVTRAHTLFQTELPGLAYAIAAGTEGLEVECIDYQAQIEDLDGPPRVVDDRVVVNVPSFLAEVRRRPLDPDTSTVTARESALEVTAVYDDHAAGMATNRYGNRTPGRREDRLTLKLGYSREWLDWLAIDDKAMDQETFGDVIEERLHTIVEADGSPAQADLLQVIDNLRITSNGHAESRINRANGSQVIELHDDAKVSAGTLTVPDVVRFAVPVYESSPVRYEFSAWFRVRVDHGKVLLRVKLKPYRPTLRAAWTDVLTGIESGLPYGEDSAHHQFQILHA